MPEAACGRRQRTFRFPKLGPNRFAIPPKRQPRGSPLRGATVSGVLPYAASVRDPFSESLARHDTTRRIPLPTSPIFLPCCYFHQHRCDVHSSLSRTAREFDTTKRPYGYNIFWSLVEEQPRGYAKREGERENQLLVHLFLFFFPGVR